MDRITDHHTISGIGPQFAERDLNTRGPVCIENNVLIGPRVTVLPGVTVGKGSVIGAGAVVTRSVPPYSVATGTPARIKR